MAKRILIADDSVTIQRAFAMTFAGADDVTLTSARSADEGLAIAQKMHPDLIIADGVMPGRSGYELCAQVRSDPALRTVPVLILASSQQPYDEGKGQKSGANGHLLKPWETNAIIERVRATLGGGAVQAPVPLAPSARVGSSMPAAAIEDDEYGEISIDVNRDPDERARVPTPPPVDPRARVATPPPPRSVGRTSSPSLPPLSAVAPQVAAPTPPAPGSSPHLRPSLIPGMRPGAVPPARPGTVPVRPTAAAMPAQPAYAPPRPTAAPVGRTMLGLPAANVPIPGVMRPGAPPPVAPAPPPRSPSVPVMPLAAPHRAPTAPVAPLVAREAPPRAPTAPVAPLVARAPVPTPPMPVAPLMHPVAPAAFPSAPAAAITGGIDQRLAAISAKGPEYEAIARLSREIIEQVVWEVVPELAEAIIREHLDKRGVGR